MEEGQFKLPDKDPLDHIDRFMFVKRLSKVGIAERIKLLRAIVDLDQTDFGKTVGVHRVTVSSWELGKYKPEDRKARLISLVYGLPVELFTREGTMEAKRITAVANSQPVGANKTPKKKRGYPKGRPRKPVQDSQETQEESSPEAHEGEPHDVPPPVKGVRRVVGGVRRIK